MLFINRQIVFAKIKTAIRAYNSGDGGGYFGIKDQEPWEYGNSFELCNRNIFTYGNNSALKIRCNQCDNPQSALYDVNFLNGGELATQGLLSFNWPGFSFNPNRRPAGNQFVQNEGPQDYTYHEIKSSSDPYAYIHHNEFIGDDPWRIMPKAEWNVGATYPSVFLIESFNSYFQTDESCKPVYENSPYNYKLFIQNMGSALQLKDSISSILDNGNTTYLLDMISNHHSGDNLSSSLKMNSPLSDTVLNQFIDDYPLAHGQFKQVMERNLPVSKDIEPKFKQRLQNIPRGIANQLLPLQAYNPDYLTPEAVHRDLNSIEALRQKVESEMLISYIKDGDTTGYVNHIKTYNTKRNQKLLLSYYMREDSLQQCRSLLTDYPAETEIDSLWQHYMDILLTLREDGKTLYDIPRSGLMFLETMAADCSKGVVNAYARNLLSMLYDREFEPCDYTEPSMKSTPPIQQEPEESVCQVGNVFPNPCSNELFLPYHCDDEQDIQLRVLDMTGRLIYTDALSSENSTYRLGTKDLVPGAYHLNVIFSDGTQKNIKFVKQ